MLVKTLDRTSDGLSICSEPRAAGLRSELLDVIEHIMNLALHEALTPKPIKVDSSFLCFIAPYLIIYNHRFLNTNESQTLIQLFHTFLYSGVCVVTRKIYLANAD